MTLEKKKTLRPKTARLFAAFFLLAGVLLGIFDVPSVWNKWMARAATKPNFGVARYLEIKPPFLIPQRLGLDIQGGVHLVYKADLGNIASSESANSMEALRDVIERRVNFFGVAEPLVYEEKSGGDWRLVVELAGIRNISEAIRLIGETPYLEFKEQRPDAERDRMLEQIKNGENIFEDPYFMPTPLTGRFLKRAQLDFDQTTFEPQISLELTEEGAKIFGDITKRNIGKSVAIYLDGAPLSTPVVREEITGGRAQITGSFTPVQAKELVGRLNAGALPVPITLIVQQAVGASLGEESLARSLYAGLVGFLAVAVFMIVWYRLPGIISVLALLLYIVITLAIFKLIPVTLSIAGIAGFILSVGMAVDANILIFERMKEELRQGKILEEAIREGFGRAWTSIRDSNISSLITSVILYWMGTSVVRGFALTLGIGIVISMFSAISVTRTLLLACMTRRIERSRFIFLSGLSHKI